MRDVPDPATRSYFVRSIFAGRDIELFMVTAVATILIVRSILAASGWPQLGGGKVHFAHLLWGGLGMLIALVLFMGMQGRLWKELATLSAGIGFGLFIDELGKFVTSDNDYFFQPAVAFMYLVFVALYLVARYVLTRADPSPQAALVNAFDLAKEAVIHDLDETERGQIIALLSRCDQDDPVVRDLAHIVADDSTPSDGLRDPYQRLKARLRRFYDRLVARRWFRRALVAYLAVLALSGVLSAIAVTAIAIGQGDSIALGFWDYGQLISASISATLVVVGFVRWRRSRLTAYRWFERGLLVSLFVTQFFAFYNNQTTQAFNVIVILLTYAVVKGMITEEEARQEAAGA